MGISNGNGQGIDSGLPDKVNGLARMGVMALLGIAAAFLSLVKLSSDQVPQFAFDNAVMLMGVFDNATANLDVFLERLVTGIDHNTGEAFIDAVFAELEAIAMVQVHGKDRFGPDFLGRANHGF
jgi:hypothetical protein